MFTTAIKMPEYKRELPPLLPSLSESHETPGAEGDSGKQTRHCASRICQVCFVEVVVANTRSALSAIRAYSVLSYGKLLI
jgi:hypothetical protein